MRNLNKILAEADIGNKLSAHMGVQFFYEFTANHTQVSTQGGSSQTNEEGLIVDADVSGVSGNSRSCNLRPRLNETPLQQRCLQSLRTKVAQDKVANRIDFAFEHLTNPPIFNMKQTMVEMPLLQNLVEMVTVRISNKNLTKT